MFDRKELVEAIVHSADLSGQVMDKPYALESGKMVMMEFHRQHLREVAERLPVTPFMAKLTDPLEQAKCQLGFLVYVVVPLWRAMAEVFPDLLGCYQNVETRVVEIDFDHLDQWQGVNWDIMKTTEPLQSVVAPPPTLKRPSSGPTRERPSSAFDDEPE
eukprot:CAMPEP_0202846812 /NCGR_PEP_ID=MMETSP1389-20130828/73842_1 /ASSEMBLY_ACC=CAM_ASM_000865 /TAXON_ID=302021 /ORGANISM="Rhodomonas sp., Strain CCMP768" /LENGTH=158 /DNA_ID=CAMNT_0049524429 /DNA_START=9 /DNA_END=485 /DNA_ORIENTATION=+